MKTFKDLKKGDHIYYICWDGNYPNIEIHKEKIIDISYEHYLFFKPLEIKVNNNIYWIGERDISNEIAEPHFLHIHISTNKKSLIKFLKNYYEEILKTIK